MLFQIIQHVTDHEKAGPLLSRIPSRLHFLTRSQPHQSRNIAGLVWSLKAYRGAMPPVLQSFITESSALIGLVVLAMVQRIGIVIPYSLVHRQSSIP